MLLIGEQLLIGSSDRGACGIITTTAAAAQKTIVLCQGCRALDSAGLH